MSRTDPETPPASSRWSIALLILGSLAVIAFFVAQNPPGRALAPVEAGENVASGAASAVADVAGLTLGGADADTAFPAAVNEAPQYRAAQVLSLRVGPGDRYSTIGQVARGATVEVIGRNEKGDWLAVSLNPGSTLYGWVKVTTISGVGNVGSLPVTPVKLLP